MIHIFIRGWKLHPTPQALFQHPKSQLHTFLNFEIGPPILLSGKSQQQACRFGSLSRHKNVMSEDMSDISWNVGLTCCRTSLWWSAQQTCNVVAYADMSQRTVLVIIISPWIWILGLVSRNLLVLSIMHRMRYISSLKCQIPILQEEIDLQSLLVKC